jgi:hypothetical protein
MTSADLLLSALPAIALVAACALWLALHLGVRNWNAPRTSAFVPRRPRST